MDTNLTNASISDSLDRLYRPGAEDVWERIRLEGFSIVGLVGEGRFGTVYKATDNSSGRHLAIKVARWDVLQSDELKARFRREFEINQTLDHPGIIRIEKCFEFGNNVLFYTMPFSDGKPLSDWMASFNGLPPWQEILRVVQQLAEAIEHGHQLGVVHRDLKPANVLVHKTPHGSHVHVLDYGLGCELQSSLLLSGSSMILGTPLYMSPEQLDPQLGPISPATDVFALGTILHTCLTGEPPFLSDCVSQVFFNIRVCKPKPLASKRQDLPEELQRIVDRCLRVAPSLRYATAGELARDLDCLLNGRPIQARKLKWHEKLCEWIQYPSRAREFGLGLVVLNVIVLAWAAINYPFVLLFHFAQNLQSSEPMATDSTPLFISIALAIIPAHGYLLYSAYCLSRETLSKRGQWMHLLVTLLMALTGIVGICLMPTQFAPRIDRFERLGALGLMTSFAEVQSILILLIALYRYPSQPKSIE